MSKRFWFLSVGPFDEDQVVEWVEALRAGSQGSAEIELIDNRHWYARAMDVETVRDALVAIKEGIAGSGADASSVTGLVSDMETWLEREFDSRPE